MPSTLRIISLSLTFFWLPYSILPRVIVSDDACTPTVADGSCTNQETLQEETNSQPLQTDHDEADDTLYQSSSQSEDKREGPPLQEPWDGPSEQPIWWTYDFNELFDYLDCGNILPGYATIYEEGEYILGVENHTLDTLQIANLTAMWDEIRIKYKEEVNLSPPGSSKNVVVVPAEIGDAGPDKGRGVFVQEFVPRGTLVQNTDSETVGIFKDGNTWRKFIATLPTYTACNAIEWSWAQEIIPKDGTEDIRNGFSIYLAWDESSLLNNADWEDSEEDPNVKCGEPPDGWLENGGGHIMDSWGPCRFHYYALEDLQVGQELLLAYGEFEDFHRNWPMLGLPVGD
jgi:hypothetical protein